MNRFLLALAGLALLATAEARLPVTFQEAVTAYREGHNVAARESFRLMAHAGLPDAQFNLGAMMLHGQGGSGNPVEGTLWIKLAADEDFEPAAEALEAALSSLDSAQRQAFSQRLPEWAERYSRTALRERHAPVHCTDNCREDEPTDSPPLKDNEVIIDERRARVHRRRPQFPPVPARKGIPGYVQIGAWLEGDGRFHNPHVIFSDPERMFNESALEAINEWEVTWARNAPDTLPHYISQTIVFEFDERSWERQARRQLERLIDGWDENLAQAYRAAWLADNLGYEDLFGGAESLVSMMHDAALAGLARAQIDLHTRLEYGNGVLENDEASLFWLQQAALRGNPRAQFLLATRDDCDKAMKDSLLRSAAENGSVPAIMTVLRNQIKTPQEADRALLADLLNRLPKYWYRTNPDHSLVERAKALASR